MPSDLRDDQHDSLAAERYRRGARRRRAGYAAVAGGAVALVLAHFVLHLL